MVSTPAGRPDPGRERSRAPLAAFGLAVLVVLALFLVLAGRAEPEAREVPSRTETEAATPRPALEAVNAPTPLDASTGVVVAPENEVADPDAAHAIVEAGAQRAAAMDGAGEQVEHDPEDLQAWQRELASRIAAERVAEQGDLLTPELVGYLQRRTRALLDSDVGGRVRAALDEVDPTDDGDAQSLMLAVNAVYPDDEPLALVPPSLLAIYPPLPEGIEYRFVGCRLILLERDSSLILDYTEECVL